jgi:hypothetical protein
MKKFTLILSLGAGILFSGAAKSQSFFEDFEDITQLTGWDTLNVSNPQGTITNWFQGNSTVFAAYSNNGYIGANYNMTAGTGTISAWLVSPPKWMHDGDKIIFATRKTDSGATNYPDRMQVRLSTSGANSIMPVSETDLGSFTTLLLDIDPNYVNNSFAGGYPYVWKSYTLTLSGLPGGQTGCRFAFRYFVENGGPTGTNSDYIGIDSVAYVTTFNGIENHYNLTDFSFYPNPSKGGVVNMSIKAQGSQERTVSVCDMLGNVVFQNVYATTHFTMNLGNLPAGMYFVNVKDEHGTSSKKLIIE